MLPIYHWNALCEANLIEQEALRLAELISNAMFSKVVRAQLNNNYVYGKCLVSYSVKRAASVVTVI